MENGAFAGVPDPYNLFGYINPESGSQVIEVIETSKCRAKMMVDVAIQVCWPELLYCFLYHAMLITLCSLSYQLFSLN
jgi:hypothetical protein